MPLGIGMEQMPGARDSGLVPDCGHHILQRPPRSFMIKHIIGGQKADIIGFCHCGQRLDPRKVIAGVEIARSQMPKRG